MPEVVDPQHLFLIVYAWHLHFGFAPQIVFRVFGDNVGGFLGIGFSKDAAGEAFEPCLFVAWLDGVRVPCIVHDEVYRHLLGFQVADVDDPDAVDAGLVGEVELFAEFGYGGGVDPSVVPGASVHVDVVIESKPTFALALEVAAFATDVAPVVVAQEEGDVVGYGEADVVVSLHFSEDSPQLWHGIGLAIDVLDDFALTFYHLG